jgi:hypothetical protein
VLDTGKDVAPQPIEDALATQGILAQAMVVGDDEKFIAVILVPDMAELERRAEKEGYDLPDGEEARCDDDTVRGWAEEAVARAVLDVLCYLGGEVLGQTVDLVDGHVGHHEREVAVELDTPVRGRLAVLLVGVDVLALLREPRLAREDLGHTPGCGWSPGTVVGPRNGRSSTVPPRAMS